MVIVPFWHKNLLIVSSWSPSVDLMNEERGEGDHNLATVSMREYRVAGKAGKLPRAGSNTFGSSWHPVCSEYTIYPVSSQLMCLNNLPWQAKLVPCTHHDSVEGDRASTLLDLVLLLTVNFTFTGSVCSLEVEDGFGFSELEMNINLLSWNSWNIIQ